MHAIQSGQNSTGKILLSIWFLETLSMDGDVRGDKVSHKRRKFCVVRNASPSQRDSLKGVLFKALPKGIVQKHFPTIAKFYNDLELYIQRTQLIFCFDFYVFILYIL